MTDKPRCQSCGQPLGEFVSQSGQVINSFGTNQDRTSLKRWQ